MGVYREAGYIVHLIYNFTPLPEAFLNDIHKTLKQLMQTDDEYLDSLLPEDLAEVMSDSAEEFTGKMSDTISNIAASTGFGLAAASFINQGKQVHQTLA